MRQLIASVALVLASAQMSAAQSPGPQPPGFSMGLGIGPRTYVTGAKRRTAAVQLFARQSLTRTISAEAELAGGGGSDADVFLTEVDGSTPVVTHFAGNLGVNIVYRTPGRVGFIASAGPGIYIEQRDTELGEDEEGEPNVIARNNDYTLGAQASAGIDIGLGSGGLFSLLRYEGRALRAPHKLTNWQVLTGFRLGW